jgi:hypothetical protein
MRSVKRFLAVSLLALALPASAFAWGGGYPTGDGLGTSVQINVSAAIAVDDTLPQGWATYLGTLVHGPELAKLTLDLAPLDEVQRICGSAALACYDPDTETIEASPDNQLDEPSAQEIVTHEYGHHVAQNRLDNPWTAEDYGTKRWASYENICARAADGELTPGNEGVAYTENPGEAFAETYRVLNLTHQGATSIGWEIVDRKLYPDATALSLLEQDVIDPWTGPSLRHVTGTFGYGSTRKIGLVTTLDGSLVARLHAPAKSTFRLSLWNGSRLVQRSPTTVRYEICGQRALTLKVERVSGKGAFTVDISKP